MRKILMWCLIFVAASAALGGLYLSMPDKINAQDDKPYESTEAFKLSVPFNITLIGDSIAKGTGDEEGYGFSTYIPEYIKDNTPQNISLFNDGIDGLKSSELVELIRSGNLDSHISLSDMILLSIGGNDLLSINSADDSKKIGALYKTQAEYLDNLKYILKAIRDKNPDAFIAFTGLYNPKEDTSSPMYETLLDIWNGGTRNVIREYDSAAFIETDDLFKGNLKSFISSDRLHPSSAGYEAISQNIVDTMEQM